MLALVTFSNKLYLNHCCILHTVPASHIEMSHLPAWVIRAVTSSASQGKGCTYFLFIFSRIPARNVAMYEIWCGLRPSPILLSNTYFSIYKWKHCLCTLGKVSLTFSCCSFFVTVKNKIHSVRPSSISALCGVYYIQNHKTSRYVQFSRHAFSLDDAEKFIFGH